MGRRILASPRTHFWRLVAQKFDGSRASWVSRPPAGVPLLRRWWSGLHASGAAENSGHVSGTVEHSQYECAVVEGLEDNQVVSVCADPYLVAQVRARHVAMRPVGNLLAVLPYFSNE